MKAAAKTLRDEAKAAAKNAKAATEATIRGSIKEEGPTEHYARIQYLEASIQKEISGPCRRSERRARRDLDLIWSVAEGVADRVGGFAAMRTKCRELRQEAVTGTKPFEGATSIRILAPQIIYLSELGPYRPQTNWGVNFF